MDLSIVSGALPGELTWGELKEELDRRFKSFISLGKKFGEYFESDIDQTKRFYFEDWMNDLEEQHYWLERQ